MNAPRSLPAAALLVALLAAPPPSLSFAENSSSSSPRSPIRFTDVTKASGITFKYDADLRRGRNLATMGGGVAMGDFDGDGYPDLFFVGSAASGKKPEAGPCGALYRNRGDGTFEDVTARSLIRSCGWRMGAYWVDVDGEGRLDLVVTGVGRAELWKNLGNGTFRDVAPERRLSAPGYSVGLAAGDVDGDGRVDLYLLGYLDTDYAKEAAFGAFELRLPEDYEGQEAKLNVQGADGRFVERARDAHVLNTAGRGLSAVLFDYDGDGRPDLYVANDEDPNRLYINVPRAGAKNGLDFHFVERGKAEGVDDKNAGMGVAPGD